MKKRPPATHAELCVRCSITADDARLDQVIAELAGKDLAALIAEGSAKLASVPSGGASASAAPAAAGAAAAAAPEKVEEKVEEKVSRESLETRVGTNADGVLHTQEESDDDMGFGLFD
jgi:large subunit ribosomal protein LP2